MYEANIPQSKLLAGEGNKAAKGGNLEEAVAKYSEAIELYPFDHRYMVCVGVGVYMGCFLCADILGIVRSVMTIFKSMASELCVYIIPAIRVVCMHTCNTSCVYTYLQYELCVCIIPAIRAVRIFSSHPLLLLLHSPRALSDANSALRIDITWAKGFYRRGRGLAGLKVCTCTAM